MTHTRWKKMKVGFKVVRLDEDHHKNFMNFWKEKVEKELIKIFYFASLALRFKSDNTWSNDNFYVVGLVAK